MFKRFDTNLSSRGLERRPTGRSTNRKQEAASVLPKYPHLDRCDKLFIQARTDPFANFGSPPCNPIMNPANSIKFRVFQYMQGFSGTTGNAFAVCTPYAVVNGSRAFACSDTAYASPFAWDTSGGIGSNIAVINDSPVTNVSGRYKIVGCGVKVGYTGPLLQSSGTVYPFSTVSNFPQVQQDFFAMVGNQNAKRETFSPGKEYVEYFTTKNGEDDDWRSNYNDISGFGGVVGICMQGMSPGTTFVAQFALWYEWIPGPLDSNLKGLLTASDGTDHPVMLTQSIATVKDKVSQTHHGATSKTLAHANNALASKEVRKENIKKTPGKGFINDVEHVAGDLTSGIEDAATDVGDVLEGLFGGLASVI